jgi:hypothetical protein
MIARKLLTVGGSGRSFFLKTRNRLSWHWSSTASLHIQPSFRQGQLSKMERGKSSPSLEVLSCYCPSDFIGVWTGYCEEKESDPASGQPATNQL